MSRETLRGIQAAIAAHLADIDDGEYPAVLGDWFVGFSMMRHDPDDVDDEYNAILHGAGYVTSPDATPHAMLGIALRATTLLESDLAEDEAE